jgi:hypothetical protein
LKKRVWLTIGKLGQRLMKIALLLMEGELLIKCQIKPPNAAEI